jgi:hypothetical protein
MVTGGCLCGIGGETLFVALLTGRGLWFAGRRLGVAIATLFSVSRLDSWLTDLTIHLLPSLSMGWQPPLYLSATVAGVSLVTASAYAVMDRRRLTAAGFTRPTDGSLRELAALSPNRPGKYVPPEW